MSLVTFDQAKAHLAVDHNEDDTLIQVFVDAASDIVLDYLKKTVEDLPGSPSEVPPTIEAATLLVIGALYENRDGAENAPQPLSQAVKDLLHRYRDPALA